MEELKVRLLWIEHALNGRTGLTGALSREFCFLQLRLSSELIAIASLVAHGDIKEASAGKLRKEYAADRILTALERLHPQFYPMPVVHEMRAPGHHHFATHPGPHLTKGELIALYRRCGGVLHKGHLDRIQSGPDVSADLDDVREAHLRLHNLVSTHAIRGFNPSNASVCLMHLGSERPVEFVAGTSGSI